MKTPLFILIVSMFFWLSLASAQSNKIVFGPLEGNDAGVLTVRNGEAIEVDISGIEPNDFGTAQAKIVEQTNDSRIADALLIGTGFGAPEQLFESMAPRTFGITVCFAPNVGHPKTPRDEPQCSSQLDERSKRGSGSTASDHRRRWRLESQFALAASKSVTTYW